MNIGDVKNIIEMLRENANTYFETELSLKIAQFKLEIDEIIKVYNDMIERLLATCAEKDENSQFKHDDKGNIFILPEKQELWKAELDKIDNLELKTKITFTLDEINKLKLTPAQADVLLKIRQEETPKD